MFRLNLFWLILGACLISQTRNADYPDWFLNQRSGEAVVGLSKKVSNESVTVKEAYLDALAINELLHNGAIRANLIASQTKLADSLGMRLGNQIKFPGGVTLIRKFTVGDLFCGLFSFNYDNNRNAPIQLQSDRGRIRAIGKQTIHPDRIFEAWASAEIEAFKKLSMIKISKVQSITKKSGKKFEGLIFLQSNSKFSNAKIERRWVKNNVAHVEVSDTY